MITQERKSPIHWNYFLAIEEDLSKVARFVEFSTENLSTYSIEIAHILLAAASEVDVIAKMLCKKINPDSPSSRIDEYRNEIRPHYTHIEKMPVLIRRYGLTFTPWLNWQEDKSPNWWKEYNNIKHERNSHFPEANLQNALNAMGGLFILLLYLYKEDAEEGLLVPNPSLFKVDEQYDGGLGIMGSDIYLQYNLP
jgi:hypothetical protein